MPSLALQVSERERRGVGVSTAERVRHAGETALELLPDGRQRIAQALLDRLHARGSLALPNEYDRQHVNDMLFRAGDQLRHDKYAAGFVVSGSAPLEPSDRRPAGALPRFLVAEHAADAARRYTAALSDLSPLVREIVDLVCWGEPGLTMFAVGRRVLGHTDRKSAEVGAKSLLRVGLGSVAKRYRMG